MKSYFQQDNMISCSELLGRSNDLYRLMLECLQNLQKSQENATPQQLRESHRQFSELQAEIEASDRLLGKTLDPLAPRDEHIDQLLQERKDLIQQVLERNRAVMVQTRAIKSLLGDEIRKSTAGHAALKGYRTPDQQQRTGSFRKAM